MEAHSQAIDDYLVEYVVERDRLVLEVAQLRSSEAQAVATDREGGAVRADGGGSVKARLETALRSKRKLMADENACRESVVDARNENASLLSSLSSKRAELGESKAKLLQQVDAARQAQKVRAVELESAETELVEAKARREATSSGMSAALDVQIKALRQQL